MGEEGKLFSTYLLLANWDTALMLFGIQMRLGSNRPPEWSACGPCALSHILLHADPQARLEQNCKRFYGAHSQRGLKDRCGAGNRILIQTMGRYDRLALSRLNLLQIDFP